MRKVTIKQDAISRMLLLGDRAFNAWCARFNAMSPDFSDEAKAKWKRAIAELRKVVELLDENAHATVTYEEEVQ